MVPAQHLGHEDVVVSVAIEIRKVDRHGGIGGLADGVGREGAWNPPAPWFSQIRSGVKKSLQT